MTSQGWPKRRTPPQREGSQDAFDKPSLVMGQRVPRKTDAGLVDRLKDQQRLATDEGTKK